MKLKITPTIFVGAIFSANITSPINPLQQTQQDVLALRPASVNPQFSPNYKETNNNNFNLNVFLNEQCKDAININITPEEYSLAKEIVMKYEKKMQEDMAISKLFITNNTKAIMDGRI